MKNYYAASVAAGALTTLTQAIRENIVAVRLAGLLDLWNVVIGGPGAGIDIVFFLLLIFGSIVVGVAVLDEGFIGFYVTLCGFLGSYATLLGALISDPFYISIGLILAISGGIVAVLSDREKSIKEHRMPYV